MPGGLLALVCYGNENIILNGNPQFTYWYKTFKSHTHFSQEPIQIPLEGPGQLQMDAPILLKAKIPRQGDLLSDLTLRVEIPDIFSKAFLREIPSTQALDYALDRAFEFQWVRQLGARLIDTVTFTIGGTLIQQFNSDWIVARALLDLDNTRYQKWRVMVGDVPELFDPAQGVYSDPSGLYPNVVAWRGSQLVQNPIQNSAPSIPGRILRIPLGLWFSDFIENSLPLVALQYHDCEINIQMRPIRDLYTVLDPSGVRVRPGVQSAAYIPSDQYPTVWNPTLYGRLPPTLNNLYKSAMDVSGNMRYFLTDISGAVPVNDGWPLNATLEALYTFVQDDERKVFAERSLRYTVRQMQNFIFSGINTRSTYRLDVHNVATRIVFYGRRSDAIPYRNQRSNLTNWMYPTKDKRPFAVPVNNLIPNSYVIGNNVYPLGRSGLNVQGLQRRILRNMFITANGQPLFDSQDPEYFTEYVGYRYLKGNSMPYSDYGLATQAEMWPLHVYSFALDASSVEQPSGTLNTSKINKLELDIDVEQIPTLANYTYELNVYVETLNFLEIRAGLGGLKFAK